MEETWKGKKEQVQQIKETPSSRKKKKVLTAKPVGMAIGMPALKAAKTSVFQQAKARPKAKRRVNKLSVGPNH